MRRKLLAFFCAAALLLSAVPAAAALTGEQQRSADILYTLGLARGTGGASGYALSGPATRAAAVTMAVRLSGGEAAAAKGDSASPFTDLPAWAKNTVAYAYASGWVTGTGARTFSPNAPVSADACCAFFLRMLGYSDADGDFSVSGAARFARHIGLTTQEYSGVLTRGDLFALCREALVFPYKGGTETVIDRLIGRGLVSAAGANAAGLLSAELTARQIADRYSAAVFQLDSYAKQEYLDAGLPSSNSSGFFLSQDGLAVTNYHAIRSSIYSTVTLATGECYPVERVLYYDAGIDVAVLRVSKTSTENEKTALFPCLTAAASDDVRAGDAVYTLSSPLGLGLNVSAGIISSRAAHPDGYTLPMLQSTADISQGSSGGALLNVYGQVIGVTTGAFTFGNSMYLAVPMDPVLSADLSGEGWTLAQVAAKQAELDALESEETA